MKIKSNSRRAPTSQCKKSNGSVRNREFAYALASTALQLTLAANILAIWRQPKSASCMTVKGKTLDTLVKDLFFFRGETSRTYYIDLMFGWIALSSNSLIDWFSDESACLEVRILRRLTGCIDPLLWKLPLTCYAKKKKKRHRYVPYSDINNVLQSTAAAFFDHNLLTEHWYFLITQSYHNINVFTQSSSYFSIIHV